MGSLPLSFVRQRADGASVERAAVGAGVGVGGLNADEGQERPQHKPDENAPHGRRIL